MLNGARLGVNMPHGAASTPNGTGRGGRRVTSGPRRWYGPLSPSLELPIPASTHVRRLLGAVLLLASACTGATEPPPDAVEAHATSLGIVATNHADVPARYLAFEPGWLALVNLVACSDVNDPCPRIGAGQSITIPWAQVGGYSPDVSHYRLSWSLVRPLGASGLIDVQRP